MSVSDENPPLVSVIMAAYNAERFIARAIASVLKQTYARWELIVVDDGSTDGTAEVVRGFSNEHIQYLRTANRGPSAARNAGIDAARGEIVAFLDADDLWFPEKLAAQVSAMEADPGAGLCYTRVRTIDEAGRAIATPRHSRAALPEGDCLDRVLVRNLTVTSSVILRRAALDRAGRFDENLLGPEDWDLWRRVAVHYRFLRVPRILAAYRMTGGTVSGRHNVMNRNVQAVIERSFSDPEVIKRFTPGRLARLRRRAEAALQYDMGWRSMRTGDAGVAVTHLVKSLRLCVYDFRQVAMLVAALTLRLPLLNRQAILKVVKK